MGDRDGTVDAVVLAAPSSEVSIRYCLLEDRAVVVFDPERVDPHRAAGHDPEGRFLPCPQAARLAASDPLHQAVLVSPAEAGRARDLATALRAEEIVHHATDATVAVRTEKVPVSPRYGCAGVQSVFGRTP